LKNQNTRELAHPKIFSSPKAVQRKILSVLVVCIVAITLLLVFSPNDSRTLVADVIMPSCAGAAAALSLIVVYRQKIDGLFGRMYLALALGNILWFVAEVIWSHNEIGLKIENPFPSTADLFWLIGYAPFVYYILKSYKFFNSNNTLSKPIVLAVFISATILVVCNILVTANAYAFSKQQDVTLFLISIAYPILDIIFVVPAALIILNNSGVGQLTSIPWIFISMMITALADSIFGISSSAGFANEASLIWNPIYVVGYSLMAAGLYWHNRFFIFSRNKVIQE
jgi:hypothetical protein